MCDQGHVLTFTSKDCKIRREELGKLVATTTRTPNNIYTLDEIKRESVAYERKMRVGSSVEEWDISN